MAWTKVYILAQSSFFLLLYNEPDLPEWKGFGGTDKGKMEGKDTRNVVD